MADFYAAMESLAIDLMRLFALVLGLSERFFDDNIDDHMTNMCSHYYYPQLHPPLPGHLRKGPNTDWAA